MYDKKTNLFSNNIKRMRCDNFFITLTHPFVLLFFTILLNDSCDFHIHALRMYVLPRGYVRDENTSHLDYTQVFH